MSQQQLELTVDSIHSAYTTEYTILHFAYHTVAIHNKFSSLCHLHFNDLFLQFDPVCQAKFVW